MENFYLKNTSTKSNWFFCFNSYSLMVMAVLLFIPLISSAQNFSIAEKNVYAWQHTVADASDITGCAVLKQAGDKTTLILTDRTPAVVTRDWNTSTRKLTTGSGYYSTYKDPATGVWHLVDPLGYQFYSIGINTAVQESPAEINRQMDDLKTKYGINTAGNWSDRQFMQMPHTFKFNLMLQFLYLNPRNEKLKDNNIMPLFDGSFLTFCKKSIADTLLKYNALGINLQTKANLVGFFSDNETELGNSSTASTPSLLEKYTTASNYLNAVGDPTYEGAKTWLQNRHPGVTNPSPDADDKKEFIGFLADTYYSICRTALKEKFPNHLYLGSRLHRDLDNEFLFDNARKYVDVVSVNHYNYWDPQSARFEKWAGIGKSNERPLMITEFYAMADEHRVPAGLNPLSNRIGAGWNVKTQQDRADFFEHFVLNLLAKKTVVGFHWFKYRDIPNRTDRDTEATTYCSRGGHNSGLYDYNFQAYMPLQQSFNKITRNIYNLRDWMMTNPVSTGLVKDAYVRSGTTYYRDTYGLLDEMIIKNASLAEANRKGLFSYTLGTGLVNSEISSVKLKMFCKSTDKPNEIAKITLLGVPSHTWEEETVSFENAPAEPTTAPASNPIATASIGAAGKYYEWDITQDFKNRLGTTFVNRSYLIVEAEGGALISFNTKEATENRPYIEITRTTAGVSSVIKQLSELKLEPVSTTTLSVYPNPVRDVLQVSLPSTNEMLTIKIYDLSGRLVKELNNYKSDGQLSINLSHLNTGMYVMRVDGITKSFGAVRIIKE